MSTVVFRRPLRELGPPHPEGEITLQEPPGLPEPGRTDISTLMTFLPMGLMMGGGALIFARPDSGPAPFIFAGVMVFAMVLMMVGNLVRTAIQRRQAVDSERRDYLRYLAQLRRQLRAVVDDQRASLSWRHPDPGRLWTLAGGTRLWERRPGDLDFSEARIGVGVQRIATPVAAPQTKPVEDLEPLCAKALRRFLVAFEAVPDLPVALLVRRFARIMFSGDDEQIRGVSRALIAQLVTFHSPDDLRIAVCVSPERAADWEWVKWLPHNQDPEAEDGAGSVRLRSDSYPGLEQLIGVDRLRQRARFDPSAVPSAEDPHFLVVLDGVDVPAAARCAGAGFSGFTVLDVGGSLPWRSDRMTMRLRVRDDEFQTVGSDEFGDDVFTTIGRPDSITLEQASALARTVSPFRLGGSVEKTEALSEEIELTELLGIDDPSRPDLTQLWANKTVWERMRVPIGVSADGSPVELDIKESAFGGSGPHGMLIGATGSGKSELLRTLVLSLALTHSPETLNIIMVDFKGGATFMGLEELPHTSAVITNLADDLSMVDRMQDSLHGELVRRQEVLRKAGQTSQHEYEKARQAGSPITPMPTLFVVVDEFSELLAAKREFVELFVMIGRLGRSLGVHLLLASQRLDEGRLHALESHLSYRIGLRTFSVMESRAVLGVPDASGLPPTPGAGFLKTDSSTLTRFKAAYVSGPFAPRGSTPGTAAVASRNVGIVDFGAEYVAVPDDDVPVVEAAPAAEDTGQKKETVLEVLASRLRGQGTPAQQVWLPPLAEPPTLAQLVGGLQVVPEFGLTRAVLEERGGLAAPVAIIDKPFEQRREVMRAHFEGSKGHGAVVGAPQTGKSTLLRTIILSLALGHTAVEVQFYCLDFGGGTLNALRSLPHMGGVAGRRDAEKVTRTLAEMTSLINSRERVFTELGVESMGSYRRMRREGRVADPFGDVFLVIDGYGSFREDYPDLEAAVFSLAGRGLTFGIHLLVASNRWSELRLQLREAIGTRFELHLGEAMDSIVSPRAAAKVPAKPGRGLTLDQFHFLTGLPCAGAVVPADLSQASAQLVAGIAGNWTGPSAPPVRLLPAQLPVAELPAAETAPHFRVPLGWDETELAPVWHDFDRTPHLMVFGDNESGKTNILRLLLASIAARYPDGEARVMLGDSHRDLFDAVPEAMRLGYSVSPDVLAKNISEVVVSLRKRLPGPDITPDRLPLRDWWKGPRLFVVVDDYELFEGSSMNGALDPLLDVLPHGREISLHVIIARSSSGAGRSMNRPVPRRMWDLGTPAVLLSCDKDEGRFLGEARPRILPPGRAQFITRKGSRILQTAIMPTTVEAGVPAH